MKQEKDCLAILLAEKQNVTEMFNIAAVLVNGERMKDVFLGSKSQVDVSQAQFSRYSGFEEVPRTETTGLLIGNFYIFLYESSGL